MRPNDEFYLVYFLVFKYFQIVSSILEKATKNALASIPKKEKKIKQN